VGEQSLDDYLKNRPEEIREAKNKGIKIVGYFPGNYVPVEIIHASGALPICLMQNGDSASINASKSLLPEHYCPFAKAQIGEIILKRNPYYKMIDLIIAPITCQHLRKVSEILEFHGDIEIFKLGVPHDYNGDDELAYFNDNLYKMKYKLEELTGKTINNDQIANSINEFNKIRELLRKLSVLRRISPPSLRGSEFIKLNHASFLLDSKIIIHLLEDIYENIEKKQPSLEKPKNPRILLMGPNIAVDDYEILQLIEKTGSDIVVEEICEGVRDYWQNIAINGNPIESLAISYLKDKIPCAFMWPSTRSRLQFINKLIDDFKIDGVIWYELLCCEVYDAESYYFANQLEELNLPMLILESDYIINDFASFKIRIEAFIEMIRGDIDYD
jgi:benzoyl-CoA reductase/2-hydroxyglutaryl-CoA dehydratase subunit BcrC/BadD/HgdB